MTWKLNPVASAVAVAFGHTHPRSLFAVLRLTDREAALVRRAMP